MSDTPNLKLVTDENQIDIEQAIAEAGPPAPDAFSDAQSDPTAISAEQAAPLSVREQCFRIAKKLSIDLGFDVTDAELYSITDEQFIGPAERATARWHRKANEDLCHKLENDPRFKDMIGVAKGGAF